jgi:putative transposase
MDFAPSTYYARLSRAPSNRELRDQYLSIEIKRVYEDNFSVYGVRKMWRKLNSEEITVAKCTVERLMRLNGIEGARRGKKPKTTIPDNTATRPSDLVDRNFTAPRPNRLWIADMTYVRTYSGRCYVAFVIDVYSRFIVGWSLATHIKTELPLDALEMAIWRRNAKLDGLIHHSDRGSQYTSIRYSERLDDAGIAPSVGSVGDSYDNAMAETTIGLYKTELIYRKGAWRTPEQVELATLEWIDWWNNSRLHEGIGYVSPAEKEAMYYCENISEESENLSEKTLETVG